MKKFNLGDIVKYDNVIGYVVKIEIDPLTNYHVIEELEDPIYTIRVFGDYWKNGYFDFKATANGLEKLKTYLREKNTNEVKP